MCERQRRLFRVPAHEISQGRRNENRSILTLYANGVEKISRSGLSEAEVLSVSLAGNSDSGKRTGSSERTNAAVSPNYCKIQR